MRPESTRPAVERGGKMNNNEAEPPFFRGLTGKNAALAVFAVAAGMLGAVFFASVNPKIGLPPVSSEDSVTGRFIRHPEPQAIPDIAFKDAEGQSARLSDWRGRMVLLNLWATWCAPCKTEMPSLDRLQAKLGGKDLTVLALSADRGGVKEPAAFFAKEGIAHLKLYNDDSGDAAIQMRAAGLPLTVVVNESGQEIARLVGPANWDSPEMIAQLEAMKDRNADGQAASRPSP